MVINFFALIYTKISFTTFLILCHELNVWAWFISLLVRDPSFSLHVSLNGKQSLDTMILC